MNKLKDNSMKLSKHDKQHSQLAFNKHSQTQYTASVFLQIVTSNSFACCPGIPVIDNMNVF